jgi:long-chain acyl-CoA synthetase
MYEAQLEKDWTYIIKDSDTKLILAATESVYQKTKNYVGKLGVVENVICLDGDNDYSYNHWMSKVENEPKIPTATVTKDDIAVIIYTSGTTGFPKGVELSHENCCSNIIAVKNDWSGELENKTTLAFLPWAHVFGQTMELHSLFSSGSAMAIVSNRELIVESIPLVKPSMIISVPALFNKVYDGVMKKMNEGSPVQKSIFFGSLAIARERNHALEFGLPVTSFLAFKHHMADTVVFSKIREKLGGNLTCMASGGAATSLEVLQFFEDIGIPIVEGYGLTETSPVISTGNKGWLNRRLATTGCPLKNLDVRILDPDTKEEQEHDTDGEICVSGPSVMTGYRNNPAANKEVFFMKDGKRFFRTGDLGRMVEGKFLKITGRIKV